MSVFSDLMLEARKNGALAINFYVDLHSYLGEGLDGERRWEARATLSDHVPHVATGRSGEEALRELVSFLKATGEH